MTSQEALIAEYNTLRQEVLQRMQMNVQFMAAGLAVGSALVVYGFQAQNSIAFIAAVVTLLAALYYSAFCSRSLIKVATYIYVIIEPKIEGLQWETIVANSRKKKGFFYSSGIYPMTVCMFTFLSVGCIFFSWRFLQDYRIFNVILYSCINLIIAIFFIIDTVYAFHSSSKKYYFNCVHHWEKIEEDLQPAASIIPQRSS